MSKRFEVFWGTNSPYYFRQRAANNEITAVKGDAPDAPVVDLTTHLAFS